MHDPPPRFIPTSPPATHPAGRHVLAELTGVAPALLDDAAALRSKLTDALRAAGAHVRQVVSEVFAPRGVTVLAVLAESHASLHTWPDQGVALVDVFTCGDSADPVLAVDLLAESLAAKRLHREVLRRGTPEAVVEPLAPGLTRRWELGVVHHAARTSWQRVLIAETAHGTTLFCDEERQSAEATQLVYHEALFVPAALLADRSERVLVIGSSEGVVSQLALAAGARVVDHVDIDPDCVRACAIHLPYGYTPAELATAETHEGPVRMHYTDGKAFVQACTQRYDVIVIDLPDEQLEAPQAHVNTLYRAEFLRQCVGLLTPGGVVVSQAGSPALWRNATLRAATDRFHTVFAQIMTYVSDEHEWAFLIGRQNATPDPLTKMLARLDALPTPPTSIDARAVQARTVPPYGLRHS